MVHDSIFWLVYLINWYLLILIVLLWCYVTGTFRFWIDTPWSITGKKWMVLSEDLRRALNDVFGNHMSIWEAASLHDVSKTTSARHVKAHRKSEKYLLQKRKICDYLKFSVWLNGGVKKQELPISMPVKSVKIFLINGKMRRRRGEKGLGCFLNAILGYLWGSQRQLFRHVQQVLNRLMFLHFLQCSREKYKFTPNTIWCMKLVTQQFMFHYV